ncbi:sugar nucleotide-binding protein [Rhodocytophaga rosea]|uniref:dTDP-4-dehydrorhamnose reductase n=1 Tax=Rhodocytophaga rosea TaxID=2704465 RepID=A0A6C0GGL5_9BACT|nr:family 1 glycosylhydrolase [Rhodocytophaga rosea]QHT66820.1 sugar nucleotide-binding protein [Rhodocytophaga rosea]
MDIIDLPKDQPKRTDVALWGGIECTFNRVQNRYFNQLVFSGHASRIEDLDQIASLGIRTLRYPVLWEQVAPQNIHTPDWAWTDERLNRLQQLGIDPIAGLLHHGSGPAYTHLAHPNFVTLFTKYARMVSERYPWISHYTPVNEPLTTARFSGLYGFWYPHKKEGLVFAKALLNQCKATILAMQAIREVNPQAKLVQTEDLGKTYSTPLLAYQADLENERRWLSFDLLCGKLTPDKPMWHFLISVGIRAEELEWFVDHPCPPDIMGINHYVTSERFLDEKIMYYPSWTHGGNEYHTYADIEAVRVLSEGLAGPGRLMEEAWQRYHLPLAITEAHLSCTREEQMRWLNDMWQSAVHLREKGVDVRAVTAWALLGCYDWHNLVTAPEGRYESGVFDLRAPQPRPTALADMIRTYTKGNSYMHPLLEVAGWWQRPIRFLYPESGEDTHPAGSREACPSHSAAEMENLFETQMTTTHVVISGKNSPLTMIMDKHLSQQTAPLLIADGTSDPLGNAFAKACELRGIPYRLLSLEVTDGTDIDTLLSLLKTIKPWAIVNTASYEQIDQAEFDPDACFELNTQWPARLAAVCEACHLPLLTFSSHLVFDGRSNRPYTESSEASPLSVYGSSKAEAEKKILQANAQSLIIRIGELFDPWEDSGAFTMALQTIAEGKTFVSSHHQVFSVSYIPDLVHASLDLLIDGSTGIWHLTNEGATTQAAWLIQAAEMLGLNTDLIKISPAHNLINHVVSRPKYSILSSERGYIMPSFEHALTRYKDEFMARIRQEK